jgi:hypothetical protein
MFKRMAGLPAGSPFGSPLSPVHLFDESDLKRDTLQERRSFLPAITYQISFFRICHRLSAISSSLLISVRERG